MTYDGGLDIVYFLRMNYIPSNERNTHEAEGFYQKTFHSPALLASDHAFGRYTKENDANRIGGGSDNGLTRSHSIDEYGLRVSLLENFATNVDS